MNEQDILTVIRGYLPDTSALMDDAYYDPSDRRIYTTDMLVDGSHFDLSYFSPEDVAWKAVAVNLSDVAAMGGKPLFLLMAIGLPDQANSPVDLPFIQRFYKTLQGMARQYDFKIIGGDTVSANRLTVSATVIGYLPAGHTVGNRCQAKTGDMVLATGRAGLSAVGLQVLQGEMHGFETARQTHLRPIPRLDEGLTLSRLYSRYALMDSSDGLADAVLKIAEASRVDIQLDASLISIHPDVAQWCAQQGRDPWDLIFYGGEDFELVATVPETAYIPPGFSRIGQVVDGEGKAIIIDSASRHVTALSFERTYQHFQSVDVGVTVKKLKNKNQT